MTTTTEPNSICGLPQHLQCYSSPMSIRGGAAQEPGTDIRIDYTMPDRFLMTLSMFHANGPISGLLMYDRGEIARMRIDRPPIPSRPVHNWYFFGYLCERCQQTFLLPYWASNRDDLPGAVHHSCHGGLDIDEVPRQAIRQAANETGIQIMRQIELRNATWDNKKSLDYIAHLVAHKLETALESFWQWMVTSAIEKAEGRH